MAASGDTPGGTQFPPNTSSQTPSNKRKTTKDDQPAKKQRLNDKPTVIDITEDPLGDMVIKVGKDEGARLVRVHKAFLKLGSDVFRAMLSTRFAEGGRTFTENDPLILEDDDPDGFIKLCKVLHHQVRKEKDLKPQDLPGLAVIADKYRATAATKPILASMLGPFFGPKVVTDFEPTIMNLGIGLGDIIAISCIIDDAQLFWRTTRSAIAWSDGSSPLWETGPELLHIVPESILEMAEAVRKGELDKLEHLLRTPLQDTFQKENRYDDSPPIFCSEMHKVVGKWTYSLWHLSGSFKPFAQTSLRLTKSWSELRDIARDNLELATNCSQDHEEHYDWDDIMVNVLNAIDKSETDLRGLCLRCVRDQAPEFERGCEHSFEK